MVTSTGPQEEPSSPARPLQRLASLGIAAALAIALAVAYDWNEMSPEDFALRKDDTHTHEESGGVRYTATSIPEMRQALPVIVASGEPIVLWLGNSQLHTINQMASGDHLAPYWLRQALSARHVLPVGFSLPNANFQEYFVISTWVTSQVAPKLIIISLVFDDLREDDLRGDFRDILDPALRSALARASAGVDILHRYDAESATETENGEGKIDSELQSALEAKLTGFLAKWFPLWQARPGLRGKLLGQVYTMRNAVFGIKATSVRRLIPVRYRRNMDALEQLLGDAADRHVPVLAYIAPLRPDIAPPYDRGQYDEWKGKVSMLVRSYGDTIVNLENLVPGTYWGTYSGDDVDFMHFQGEGHKRLAAAIAPQAERLLDSPR